MKVRDDYHLKSNGLRIAAELPLSRMRSLIRDITDGLGQQMFFWGCDVRHSQGNLLVEAGMERLPREEQWGEGSSRYRMAWQAGTVELHSFCVGWYPKEGQSGAIFIRGKGRLLSCRGEIPLTPGRYEDERFSSESSDELRQTVRPLVAWVLNYEKTIASLAGADYRERCWKRYLAKVGARPWLGPAQAMNWYESFLEDPRQTPRPRLLRRESWSIPRSVRC